MNKARKLKGAGDLFKRFFDSIGISQEHIGEHLSKQDLMDLLDIIHIPSSKDDTPWHYYRWLVDGEGESPVDKYHRIRLAVNDSDYGIARIEEYEWTAKIIITLYKNEVNNKRSKHENE